MSEPVAWILTLAIAYVLGSIQFGVLIGRFVHGADIRTLGSGGTGATNVARTTGMKFGLLVLALDAGKGAAVILIARVLFDGDSRYLEAIAGLTTLVGHAWPLYHGFRGGKGVTTGWAALLVMSPWAAVSTFSGLIVASTTRYISLGSIIGSGTAVIYLVVRVVVQGHDDEPYLLYTSAGYAMVLFRHRANIRRLLRGEEAKFGARVDVSVDGPVDVPADDTSAQGE